MSKKSKKPEPKQVCILSASEMNDYIRLKFQTENDAFWEWVFSECPWGETTLLSLSNPDEIIQPQFMNYFNIIVRDFLPDADEESCIEIENDL
jgi:hypothetical protein